MSSDKIPPTIIVIFGITGDLSRRYLLPALHQIYLAKQLPSAHKIIGVTRQNITFNDLLRTNLPDTKVIEALSSLKDNFEVLTMDLTNLQDYKKLKNYLDNQCSSLGKETQIIFHFAVPPKSSPEIINLLGGAGLNTKNIKLLLEKPFGVDLESAKEVIKQSAKYFDEEQIYRIDHYLAKEMAQNITVFLGSNALFRSVWDSRFIEKINIVSTESIGIEGRVSFYESTGALRDVVQSHLLQLAALTLMDPCSDNFNLSEIATLRLKALQNIDLPDISQAIRAQYDSYRQEIGKPASPTETFVSLALTSHDPRWKNVPIRLVTGKNLDKKLTEISIYFKKTQAAQTNTLRLTIQPKEGIEFDLWVKEPGYDRRLQKLPLSFAYEQHFGNLPEAYEQVLVDAMRGIKNIFASSEEVLTTWKILQPVLEHWQSQTKDLRTYRSGSSIEEVTNFSQGS
jgi:glucose-6-phosphate 1-dehydrogenase